MAVVQINGGFQNGDQLTMDATVDGVRHRFTISRASLDHFPTTAAKQDFIARAARSQSQATAAPATPTPQTGNISGTFSSSGSAVVITGGRVNGDVLTVDGTVDGTRIQVRFLRSDLENMPTLAARTDHISRQLKAASNASPSTTVGGLNLTGTLTV